MNGPTVEEAKAMRRRAEAAFVAAGGRLPGRDLTDQPLTCSDMHWVSAIAAHYAATALLEGMGDEYVYYYWGLSEAYDTAAGACDEAAASP